MTQIVKTQRLRFRAALLAASAVAAFLTTADCFASCGDYVYSRFHTPAQHRDTGKSLTSELDSYAKNVEQTRKTPTSPAPPCSGPNCRRNPAPSLPIAPPTSVGGSSHDRLVQGQREVELPRDVFRRRDLNSPARALRGYPLLIEVPPEQVG